MALAGCQQSQPGGEDNAQADLKIVEQVQIDQSGAEVPPDNSATPADPAGDGQAQCPRSRSPWPAR